jgi:C4-dicarboxylate-specific signal transduction histidine kinase
MKYLNSLLNIIPVQAIWLNQDFVIKGANDQFLSFVNKESEDVIDSHLDDYFFDNLKKYFNHRHLLKNSDLIVLDSFEIGNIKKSIRFFINEIPLKNAFLVIGIDLSKEHFKQVHDREARQQQEENARFMLIGQLAGGVAHEINNPLAIISGLLANLKRKVESAEKIEDKSYFLEKINKSNSSVERIAMIVRGLKFLSQNDLHSSFEIVHVQKIIDSALNLMQSHLKVNDIELRQDVPSKDMMIRCRPVKIAQVIINLLMNSHDAILNDKIKWVKISFSQDSQNFIISITDSGQGIPKEIIPKIMQPFFTTKSIRKNIGLGLITSKMILRDHFGDLVIDETSPNTKFDMIFKREK